MSRTVLITGASKGIGLALAHRLLQGGHQVVGLARRPASDFPGTLVPIDLADTRATDKALRVLTSRQRFDRIVNNVGLVRPQRLGSIEWPALEEAMANASVRYCVFGPGS
jgi:NAD(P)-dependent dehydrogenase (short-subunit alcohol dehydrogenase family)